MTCPRQQAPRLLAPESCGPMGLQSPWEVLSCRLICLTVPEPVHWKAATAKFDESLVLFPSQWSMVV